MTTPTPSTADPPPIAPPSLRSALRRVLVGLVANVVLAATKLVAGLLGNSYALVADAVESLIDILGSLVVFGGVKLSRREADEDFPFGLGKAEALAGFVVGLIILLAAVGIAVQAVREILAPHHGPAPYTLAVLVGVIVTKEALYRLVRGADEHDVSVALSAEAFHHRSDALTSLAAAVGISIALWGGPEWASADDWAALVASVIILCNGLMITRRAALHLLDISAPESVVDAIRGIAASVPAVVEVEKLTVRVSGPDLWVDIHIHAAPTMSLEAAHSLGGRVKAAILEAMPQVAGVLVHMEPADT